MSHLTVQIGIHDGRLIQENSIEIDEITILKLKKFAIDKSLNLASQIDTSENAIFDYSECQKLEKELNFIMLNCEDSSIKTASQNIMKLAQDCYQKKNRRIKLYISGN